MRPGIGFLVATVCVGAAPAVPAQEAPQPRTIPRPPEPLVDIRDYPRGVTVLGPAPPTADRPVIRVFVQREPEPPEVPRLKLPWVPYVPVFDPQFVVETAAPGPPRTNVVGPGPEEQLKVLGRIGVTARGALPPSAVWTPTPAYPPGDPDRPYRWNPARFSASIIDPAWAPADAWSTHPALPAGDRSRWSDPVFDPVWRPSDAWGRSVPVPLKTQPENPPDEAGRTAARAGTTQGSVP